MPDTAGDARELATPSNRRVVHAAAWTAAGQAAVQIPWFGSLIVLAALVPPAAFGTVSAGIAVVGIATLLVGSGTRGELVAARRLTRADVRRATIRTATVAALLAAAMAAGADLLVETIARGGDAEVLRWLALGIAIYGLAVVPLAVLQRELRSKRQAGVMSAGALTGSTVAILAGALGAGVWALVVRQLLNSAVVAVLAWVGVAHVVSRLTHRPHTTKPLHGTEPPNRTEPPHTTEPSTTTEPPLVAEPSLATEAAARPRAGDAATRRWFSVLALASFLALNLDYYLLGWLRDVETLGPYALAFMIAFAPVTQVSWQLGKVLFPAAAATADRTTVGARTAEAIAGCALLLAPLLAPAVALAPWAFPAVLGDEWEPLVVPFQLLFVAGVVHALANLVGESLSGTGHVALHTRCYLGLLAGLVVLLPLLIELDGARGAAIAHLVAVIPFAAVYFTRGARTIGTSPGAIWRSAAPVAAAVAAQAAVTFAVLGALRAGGAGEAAAAIAGAAAGFAALAAVTALRPPRVLGRLAVAVRGRRAPA